MGQEIASLSFGAEDFAEFKARLQQETDLLDRWLAGLPGLDPICRPFAQGSPVGGFELEAWLVTPQGDPAPINSAYLEAVNDPLVVPELARFNIELNSRPQVLVASALQQLRQELEQRWDRCCRVAEQLQAGLMTIGILPTLQQQQLTLEMISPPQTLSGPQRADPEPAPARAILGDPAPGARYRRTGWAVAGHPPKRHAGGSHHLFSNPSAGGPPTKRPVTSTLPCSCRPPW